MNLYSIEARNYAVATLILMGWVEISKGTLKHPSNFVPSHHISVDYKTNRFYFFDTTTILHMGDEVVIENKDDQLTIDGQLMVDIVIENTK